MQRNPERQHDSGRLTGYTEVGEQSDLSFRLADDPGVDRNWALQCDVIAEDNAGLLRNGRNRPSLDVRRR